MRPRKLHNPKKAPPGSFLNIPLVARMHADKAVKKIARGVDHRWRYETPFRAALGGFNPLKQSVFYAQESLFADWIKDPGQPARKINTDEFGIMEVLYGAHDYLHCWAYAVIQESIPKLGFGTRPITAKNIEDFAFCHMMSEVVATVGLEYWYLATVDLNQVCDLGTTRKAFSVDYHESVLAEFQRFNPQFEPQKRSFFEEAAGFYLSGVMEGFDPGSIGLSNVIAQWLRHELVYSQKERAYCRTWFSYLSRETIRYSEEQLNAGLESGKPWQRKLIGLLGERLWDLVKNNGDSYPTTAADPKDAWKSPETKIPDLRFTNANRLREFGAINPESFDSYFNQKLGQCDYSRFPQELIPILSTIKQQRDLRLAERFFSDFDKLTPHPEEPRDIFLLD